jgi:proliferating cell nuclear antigen
MLLKLDNPKILSDVISLLSELVLEVKAKINKQGFEITAIDPANVALVSLKIPASAFSQFELDKDQELGLNLEDLKQVLRRASNNLTIEKQDNSLQLKFAKRAFNLALINIDAEEKQIPSLNFKTSIELSTNSFAEAVADAAVVADSCSFVANEDAFIIESKGTLNSAKTEMLKDEVKIKSETGQISKAKYSLDYLLKFAKASKIADNMALSFSSDYPGRFDFKSDNLELAFILAPRVEEE